MTDFHVYARYFNTETRTIFNTLSKTGLLKVTRDCYSQESPDNRRNKQSRFVIIENRNCFYNRAPHIYIQHGFGINGCFKKRPPSKAWVPDSRTYCVPNSRYKKALIEYGYPPVQVLNIGYPFSYDLAQPINPDSRRQFLLSLGLDPAKKTVLYAPSWNLKRWLRGLFVAHTRQFFGLWWEDNQEHLRVEKLCQFSQQQGFNLIVRLHEKKRYHRDWLWRYRDIFKRYKVPASYHDACDNLPYLLYSDVMISDYSSMMTNFYIMDKPVIHLDVYKEGSIFLNKYQTHVRESGYSLEDRAGYVVKEFDAMLDAIVDSLKYPTRFSQDRQRFISTYIDYLGEASLNRVREEFTNLVQSAF